MIGFAYLAKWRKGNLEAQQDRKLLQNPGAVSHLVLWMALKDACREKPLLSIALLVSGPKLALRNESSLGSSEGDPSWATGACSLCSLSLPHCADMSTWSPYLSLTFWTIICLTGLLSQTVATTMPHFSFTLNFDFKHRLTSWFLTLIFRISLTIINM